MTDLSLLCVTKAEPHASAFIGSLVALSHDLGAELIVAVDGDQALPPHWSGLPVKRVHSDGYIESVLDEAVDLCGRDYVLRLDDDERCSAGMVAWLKRKSYETGNHWKFARANLFGDASHHVTNLPLWPDYQTRLSVKRMSGGRRSVHAGSPFGAGLTGAGHIEHHKLLIHSLDTRRGVVERYNALEANAGSTCRAFYVPEDFFSAAELTVETLQ